MAADVPFALRAGMTGPVQQSSVTCGSAALTVARMLVNPGFARWVLSEAGRFAAYERVVMGRTNGLVAAGGRLSWPWPRALGTPPWGAQKELEYGASRGASYGVRVVRPGSRDALRAVYTDLAGLVDVGLPALLYIGNAMLPRHVTLVLRSDGSDGSDAAGPLDVYDPATGSVSELPQEAFAARDLRIAGWDVPWFLVQPDR